MKRSLDFIPKCDGKLLEGFKQRSDKTLCILKKKKNYQGCCIDKEGDKRAPGTLYCCNPAGRQARRASWARRCWWKW